MLSIYADNFRGFSKTTIDFTRVNFLVGENSTGKTSILSLFSLLQDQRFWFAHEFNTAVVNLGYFDEISSARADDRFTVGLGETELQTPFSEKRQRRYYLLEFSNRDNIPTLSSARLRSATIDVFVKWDGEKLIYGVEACRGTVPTFAEWVKSRLPQVSAKRAKGAIVDMLAQRPALHIFLQAIEEGIRDKRAPLMWNLFYPPFASSSVAWIAPIRAKPKRTYDSFKVSFSPEGDHSPYVLKDLLTSRLRAQEAVKELKAFGKDSGLFKTIKIHSHGRGKTAPFEIYIQVAGKPFRIANVGYGVAQVLPIIVELISRQPNTWFSIQQPEIHLHPKAQAELGSTIFSFAKDRGDRFLIETHSDYLIDRFRREVHDSDESPDSQLLFFERSKNENSVVPVIIAKDGSFAEDPPSGYREFFIREQLSLLGI